MSGISIGNLPNQSILKKINDIAADVDNLDLEGVNNLKSKLSELVAPELGSSDTKAISQKVVTENIQQLNTEVNNKINKVESAQNGNLPSFDNGHIKDSKIPASNIAQANGYYESMIVGASKNLAGNNIVTAKYTYRPTADTTDVADGVAKISSVKGNTIVWNQRFKDARMTFTSNGVSIERLNGVISLNGTLTASYFNIISPAAKEVTINLHHIGYYQCTIVKDLNNVLQNKKLSLLNRATNKKIEGTTVSFIYINTDDSLGWSFGFSGFTVGDVLEDVQIKVNVIDLTQMFGIGNEPTLEEFEAMFPNDYYEYNEGELRSIEDFSIKSVGFNAWDEEWELGNLFASTGNNIDADNRIRTKNYIPILPNTKYYIKFGNILTGNIGGVAYYDKNKKFITLEYPHLSNKGFTTPLNVRYMRIAFFTSYGTTYNNDICINLSHSGIRDGEYEPYREDILPINISTIKDENGEVLFPNGLCSAGEAHDELVYDKSLGKWKAIKRIGSVDMGTFDYIYIHGNSSEYDFIESQTSPTNIKKECVNIKSILYNGGGVGKTSGLDLKIYIVGSGHIRIRNLKYTDIDSFKQSLQGQILYYELAEPIEVILDDFTSNYKVSDWGTEEILMNSIPVIPVIYDVKYSLNAVDTLRNMPTNYISKESLDAFLATLGSAMGGTWTAIYNETNGRYDFTFSANAVTTELIEE